MQIGPTNRALLGMDRRANRRGGDGGLMHRARARLFLLTRRHVSRSQTRPLPELVRFGSVSADPSGRHSMRSESESRLCGVVRWQIVASLDTCG